MTTQKLPKYIQPSRLFESDMLLQGSLPLSSFPRLQEFLLNNAGEVVLDLKGGRDVERIIYINGNLQAVLHLECQRCMKVVDYPLSISLNLSPVFSEEGSKRLPERYEPLMVEDDQIDLVTLVEDELLLNLPMIPKHEDPNCVK